MRRRGAAKTRSLPSPRRLPRRTRGLTAEARSKIAELDKQIVRFRDQGQFAEAMAPAREVLEIRIRLQGASHVQTVAARDWLGRIEEMAKLPDEGRRAWVLPTPRRIERSPCNGRPRIARPKRSIGP